MTQWLPVVVSAASGAAVTLLGVVTGGVIASRSQRRQWTRDKQIDACTAVVHESTRMQLALQRRWKQGEELDWTAWNQTLALTWLIGAPDVIAKARQADRVFWLCGTRIKRGQMDETAWANARDEMESARLDFINAARRDVVGSKVRVGDVPVSRPSLSELDVLLGPPPGTG